MLFFHNSIMPNSQVKGYSEYLYFLIRQVKGYPEYLYFLPRKYPFSFSDDAALAKWRSDTSSKKAFRYLFYAIDLNNSNIFNQLISYPTILLH